MEPQEIQQKKKSMIWTAFNILAYVAIVGGLVVGLPKGLSRVLETPYPMAAITSGSMWPALKEGGLVFIKGVKEKNDIKVGDIVVYRNGERGGFTIHRVVRMGEGALITKGDANFTEDAPIYYEALVGKALEIKGSLVHIPYLGFITMFASKISHGQSQ